MKKLKSPFIHSATQEDGRLNCIHKTSGCYAIYLNGEIIYIGSSSCLEKRLKNHPVYTTLFRLFKDNVKVRFYGTSHYKKDESLLITYYKPKLNITHNYASFPRGVPILGHQKQRNYQSDSALYPLADN